MGEMKINIKSEGKYNKVVKHIQVRMKLTYDLLNEIYYTIICKIISRTNGNLYPPFSREEV